MLHHWLCWSDKTSKIYITLFEWGNTLKCDVLNISKNNFQAAYAVSMKARVFLYLLIHILTPQELLASTCSELKGACLIKNAQAISTKILHVPKRDLLRMSCLRFCATKEKCIGMNEKIDSDICHFLEEDDTMPGLEWYYNSQGYNFWSFEQTCPKVWCFCIVIIQRDVVCFKEFFKGTKPDYG